MSKEIKLDSAMGLNINEYIRVKYLSTGETSVTLHQSHNFKRVSTPKKKGKRITKKLTSNGAKSIRSAIHIANTQYDGFNTFFTFTLNQDARNSLDSDELTFGAKISRLNDNLKSRYRKHGMVPPYFVWIVEYPNNSNPHVHMISNINITDVSLFKEDDIQKLWKYGHAHIERVRNAKSIGKYLSKAALNEDQGEVIGQRYGVSRLLMPKISRGYLKIGCLGVSAFKKLISKSRKISNKIYIHEYGVWVPPSFGYSEILTWILNQIGISPDPFLI